ncbi:MAG TPA: regulatory protein RecX [Rudaea sp.]|nr:regulatory protein RecX [Rudaea sp.]
MAQKPSDNASNPCAYDKALALLVRREHSARELKSKLAQRGFDDDESAEALERLQAKDFQSDARFGEMLVRSRIESGYGPRWIVAELKTHAIGEEAANALIEAAQPDWPVLILRQLQRRFGDNPASSYAQLRKRVAFLLRRGFDAATVQSITRAQGVGASAGELN